MFIIQSEDKHEGGGAGGEIFGHDLSNQSVSDACLEDGDVFICSAAYND